MAVFMCPQCGADIDLTETNKCEFCGYDLKMIECIECGKEIPAEANTCPYCGEHQEKRVEDEKVQERAEEDEDQFLSDIESAIEADIPAEEEIEPEPEPESEMEEPVEEVSEIEETESSEVSEIEEEYSEIEDKQTSELEEQQEVIESKEPEEEQVVEPDTEVISNVEEEETIQEETEEEGELDFGHREEIEEIIEEPGIEEDIVEGEREEKGKELIEEEEYLESLEDIELAEEEEAAEEYPSEAEEFVSEEASEVQDETEIFEEEEISESEKVENKKETEKGEKELQVCPECGAENPAMAKFCLNCGSKLEAHKKEEEKKNICPECGTENLENAKFCMVCGTNLTSESTEVEKIEQEKEVKNQKEQYKVKIKYDKDNKFKYRFVKNKIDGVKSNVDENELETLMSNNNFVISIPASDFRDFKMELEELDCEVERIDKLEGPAETTKDEKKETPKQKTKEITKNFVIIEERPEKTEKWQSKFISMVSAMRPDISKERAKNIAEGDIKKIEVKTKEDGQQLGKVLSALNCKTNVVEEKVEVKEKNEKIEKEKEEEIEKEIKQQMKAKMEGKKGKKEEKSKIKEETAKEEKEKEEPKEEGKPKFLILSGVDKNNWVVRERLLEKLVKMYPNMTRDIAEGIVSQPVVKLRVKNMNEAQKYKPEFEDMGWNTRIEEVSKMLKSKKSKTSRSNINVEKRKQIHQQYLKREQSKRRNILTTILVTIFILGIGYFVYTSFFLTHNYLLVQADIGHSEVELSTSGEPVVHLRHNPRMDSRSIGAPTQVGSVLELVRKQPIRVGGYDWYEVKVPGIRGRTGYIRGDIVIPSDENGNPVSESP